ncbi:MAG: phage head closure protein [Clostridiales bacterium]|nr:phage head closure protein [Clostridiales bacterium]
MSHAGELNRRITIMVKSHERDSAGFTQEVTKEVKKPWARVMDAGTTEFYLADAQNIKGVVNFKVRYTKEIQEGMYVLYEGEEYQITQVNKGDHGRQFMILKTKRNEVLPG